MVLVDPTESNELLVLCMIFFSSLVLCGETKCYIVRCQQPGHVHDQSFVGNEELYFRDGLHLSGKGAAVLAEGLSGAVASGLGKVRYLN